MADPSLHLVEYLFNGLIPENTTIKVERARLNGHLHYIYRLQYASVRSRRTMCVVAKGDTIPFSHNKSFDFFLRQLILSPSEQAREFSRLAWLEKRARQDMFLALGKSGNPRVSEKVAAKDTLPFKEYTGGEDRNKRW